MLNKKVFSILLVLALGTSLILSSCAAPEPTPAPVPTPAPAPAPTPTPAPPQPTEYDFLSGSTAMTSSFYALYVAVCEVAMDYIPGVKVTILETGGSSDNFKRMVTDEINCGATNGGVVYEATHGLGKWEGSPQPNKTRMMFVLSVSPTTFWARVDSGITRISDLDGRKFFAGIPGSGSQTACELQLEALEVHPDYFIGSLSDAVAAMKDGRCEAILKETSGSNVGSVVMDLMTSTELRPFAFSDTEADKLRTALPWIAMRKIPAGYYPDFPDAPEMTTKGVALCYAAREDFPEEISYEWTKAAYEHFDHIVASFPGAKEVDIHDTPKLVARIPGLYLHPGAIRYYREVGIEIPDSVIPPEMK